MQARERKIWGKYVQKRAKKSRDLSRGFLTASQRFLWLTTKVVKRDVLGLDTQILKHVLHSLSHHGRPTHVVLAVFWTRVISQVVFKHNVVNEARVAFPIVFFQRI